MRGVDLHRRRTTDRRRDPDTVRQLNTLDQGTRRQRWCSEVLASVGSSSSPCTAAGTLTLSLGYCNCVLYGNSQSNLDKLQRVQNVLARVTTQAPWSLSATDLRRDLHWLPIRQRASIYHLYWHYKALHADQPYCLTHQNTYTGHLDVRDLLIMVTFLLFLLCYQ